MIRLIINDIPIDTKVDIIGKDGCPIPFGTSKTVEPEEKAVWHSSQVSLAQVEKTWDHFDLDLYMAILRIKLSN